MDDQNQPQFYEEMIIPPDLVVQETPIEIPQLPIQIQIKNAAENQIRKYYPEYKQLNTLMEGDQGKIAVMKAFIQAVRDWSNGPNPDLTVVTTIVPQS